MIYTKDKIARIIPQRPPFVMIDNLISAEKESFVSNFKIEADNIFLSDDRLEPYGMIENIAQTTAAGLSYTIRDPKKRPEEGFLGSIAKLKVVGEPKIGDLITTRVTLKMSFENMYKVYGACYNGEELLLESELKIVGITK